MSVPVVLKNTCGIFVGVLLATSQARAGKFSGEPVLQPTGDGRNMRVVTELTYTDNNGANWTVPAGSITDGASIPSVLWSIVGSPFTGKYLRAAIVHDVFCANRRRPWKQVHRIFYDAMIDAGVSVSQARVMYAAVYGFGPRWADGVWCFVGPCVDSLVMGGRARRQFDLPLFKKFRSFANAEGATLDRIERSIDLALKSESTLQTFKASLHQSRGLKFIVSGSLSIDGFESNSSEISLDRPTAVYIALQKIMFNVETRGEVCVDDICKETVLGDKL